MKQISHPNQELEILSYIRPRMNLALTEKYKQSNLLKGMEGEHQLYTLLTDQLPSCYGIFTDLLLEGDGTEFQIDILLVGENTIYPLEVKNYEGNFVIQNDNWYAVSSQNEIRNPFHQVKRMEILLRNMLKLGSFNFTIEPYIIFVNPEFYLYQAPLDLPLVFPTQINRFTKKFKTSFKINQRQKNFINFLDSNRLAQSTHERLPHYTYEGLRKGIVCGECSGFLEIFNQRYLICGTCKGKEPLESAVKRTIIEFITLFPNKKITTNIIQNWCGVIESKKTIRRILKTYLQPVGRNRHTYYVIRN